MKKLSRRLMNIIEEYTDTLDTINSHKDSIKKLSEKLYIYTEELLESIEEDDNIPTIDGRVMSIATKRMYKDWPADIQEKESELKALKAQAKRVGNVDYEIKKIITLK